MGKVLKKEGWNIALSEYLQSTLNKKFRWGSHDCVKHCSNAILAMTCHDIMANVEKYSTKKDAYEIVKARWSGDTDNIFSEQFGEPCDNCKRAMRGDVVRVTEKGQKTYGIVDDTGRFCVFITPKDGLVKLPLSAAEVYWRVE